MTILFQEGCSAPPSYAAQKPQLMNNIVDGMANTRPYEVYGEYPISPTSYELGLRKVNYRLLANAVNGIAWWLTEQFGPAKNFETLLYMGPNDVRYNVMILGAVKAGYKILLASPRNQLPAYTNLLSAADCKAIIAPENYAAPVIDQIIAAYPLPLVRPPTVEHLLDTKHPHFEYKKTFEEARNDPVIVLHTSGTASLPKPIIYTHDWVLSYVAMLQPGAPSGMDAVASLIAGTRLLGAFPQFHGGHYFTTVLLPIYGHATIIFPPAGVPLLTPQLLIEAIKTTTVDSASVPPPVAKGIAENPEFINIVSRQLNQLIYAGGALPEYYGNKLSAKIDLVGFMGSTEMGLLPMIRPQTGPGPDDWHYYMPHSRAGMEFRAHTEHNNEVIYEAFIVKNKDEVQPCFRLFTTLDEFPTSDLYTRHPTNPNMWKYFGRSDDTIVLTTGLNVCPQSMEAHIIQQPEVDGTLMVGTNRERPALLVELSPKTLADPAELANVYKKIWAAVTEANKLYDEAFRVLQSHILFTSPERRMARTAKGTVQRIPTLDIYAAEIDELYANNE